MNAKLSNLLEENDDIKKKLADFKGDSQMQIVKKEAQEQFKEQIELLQKQVRELNGQNSEYKAKEIMNALNGNQADGGSLEGAAGGILDGIGSLNGMTSERAEVSKLKAQLSQQTNQILQLDEDKDELEQKLEDIRHLYEELKERSGQQAGQNLEQSNDQINPVGLGTEKINVNDLDSSRLADKSVLDQDSHDNLQQQLDNQNQTLAEKEHEL